MTNALKIKTEVTWQVTYDQNKSDFIPAITDNKSIFVAQNNGPGNCQVFNSTTTPVQTLEKDEVREWIDTKIIICGETNNDRGTALVRCINYNSTAFEAEER